MQAKHRPRFIFDGKDDYNWKSIELDNLGADQLGHQMTNGGGIDYVEGTNDYDNVPSVDGSVWVRVTSDGSTLSVREADSQAGLDTVDPCYTSTHFALSGGQIGFADFAGAEVSNVTVKSYSTTTSSFSVTEAQENFAMDSTFNGVTNLTYDASGNLTYDGLQSYTYDAWNRLITVAHAYSIRTADGGDGLVHSGQTFETIDYDGMGRRNKKAINGTGAMDCTYHYYLSGQSVIEERNGSDYLLKQHVWGLGYIDELVQTGVNINPGVNDPSTTGTANTLDKFYFACQDANFNVLGVVQRVTSGSSPTGYAGTLAERYEYSAYEQRQVFSSSGANDPECYTPAAASARFASTTTVGRESSIPDYLLRC